MNVKKSVIWMALMLMIALSAMSPVLCFAEEKAAGKAGPGPETISDAVAPASPEAAPLPGTETRTVEMSLLDFIKKGGIVGYVIVLLSVVALGLIIDYSIRIRKSRILPPKDIEKLKSLIQSRNLGDIALLEKGSPSFLMRVTLAGLKESHLGQEMMIKAMEDAGESLTSGISRKIEHLNVIGNISPMLGLLGTVTGMLRCFNELAHVAGAIDPKQLAGGIFEALITTCLGLIVAIPSIYAYAVFKNRVDEFSGEAALTAEQLVTSFKSN